MMLMVMINRIFLCAVRTFMITGDEIICSADTSPSPQSIDGISG